MEFIQLSLLFRFSIRVCAVALVLLSGKVSYSDDVLWTGSVDNDWANAQNWEDEITPNDAHYVCIADGTVDFSSGNSPRLRGFRQSGGTLNISGGQLEATQLATAVSTFDGEVVQTGGDVSINAIEIGTVVGDEGSYVLEGGNLNIARGSGGVSLYLGASRNGSASGAGSLTLSGGSFRTRDEVKVGDGLSGTGTFTVMGTQPQEIGIGAAGGDIDGVWYQHAGSSLVLRFDIGGVTPIFLHDNTNVDPENPAPAATFENGAILNVDHLAGGGGGTWTVLEVENGDIDDQGLAFAAGVDTSVWSFRVDNSGANGRLLVTAAGDPVGFDVVVGNQRQQKMRYGMDYERLWFWTGGLNSSERDDIAKWSAIDTRIDYIRVAINCGYERNEGDFDLSAYTNRIIPMMQEMKEANPDIKFFASPRPLEEAVSGAAWQPYPRWITGDNGNGVFDFNPTLAGEYLVRYLELMKSYGFKISFMDLTNEWQSPGGNGRMTTGDFRDVAEYLKDNVDPDDMPLLIGPSAWNYSQGVSWVNDLQRSSRRRDAVDIAACHNTSPTGSAQQFTNAVRNVLGSDVEIWNTEVHDWKSTGGSNETTTFSFMLEKIRAGFSGLNGWLAIGTRNQGHSYILNPSGTPSRNVKYFIFRKLSETSNYGHALDIVSEPSQLSHTAALIKGNLMTVWVINQGTGSVPINITTLGRTISESTIKRTRWTDPDDVEGFITHEPVNTSDSVASSIPGESVCCFEILLEPEELPYTVVQAEDEDEGNGIAEEQSDDADGTLNLAFINDTSWARYNGLELVEDSAMRFRVARPDGRADGWVEVYLGTPGASTESILAGTPVGKVAVPVTGHWQNYETIEACLESAEGTFDVVLNFDEVGSDSGRSLFNFNSFSIVSPESDVLLGDCNQDGSVNFLDISPFIISLTGGGYLEEADCNEDGDVNFLDISPFIGILTSN